MVALPKFKNFAESTVEEYFDVGDTSLVINSADTSLFPTLTDSDGNYFFLTIFDGENSPEIVKVTDVNGTTFTCTRAQESTNSRAWEVGSRVRLAPTAAQLEGFASDIEDHEERIADLEAAVVADIDEDFLFCHAFLS